MDNRNGIGKVVKRELVRAVLERAQSANINRKMADQSLQTVYDDVEETLNIPYVNRDEVPLAMDVFQPKVPEKTELPVIVIVHGGGLVMGDRGNSRPYARMLAHKKYLVFSLEYRLAPRANISMQLDDLCAGMDLVGKMLVDYDVDFTRMFMVADSAGAFLAAYVTSMGGSEKLQDAIGHEASRMKFAAIGLMSGMFYTNQKDPIGWMLSDQIYGEKRMDEKFRKYMDPEHPEIIENLPPAFLVTSRGDFINNYTFMLHEALKKAGKTTHLLYFGDESLGHSFAIATPEHPKSIEATDKMLAWFEEQAKEKVALQKKDPAVERKRKRVEKRIADGSIQNQKLWANIKERRSFDPKLLKRTAIMDCTREYTYEQMFQEWERYGRVFSGLEISSKNESRVALCGAITAETLFAFYGLNMTGAVASMFSYPDFLSGEGWKEKLKEENITDLILTDVIVTPGLWPEVERAKEELGLRNVILLHSRMGGPTMGSAELLFNELNCQLLKGIEQTVFMDDRLEKYWDTPITLDRSKGGKPAIVFHGAGETEPQTYTDKDANGSIDWPPGGIRSLAGVQKIGTPLRIVQPFDFSSAMALLGLVNGPLAMGETIVLTFFGAIHPKFLRAIGYYEIDVLAADCAAVGKWQTQDDLAEIDLSPLRFVGLSEERLSPEAYETYKTFFQTHGYRFSLACNAESPETEKAAEKWKALEEQAGGMPHGSKDVAQGASYNVFSLFHAELPDQKQANRTPFPLPFEKLKPFSKGAAKEKPAVQMPELSDNLKQFGNRMLGRMFGSRSIYVDFEE